MKFIEIFIGKCDGRDNIVDLGIDGRIIIK
jgi:hypothetical protein